MPAARPASILRYLEPLNLTLSRYEINTPKRVAAFLAQLAHESGSLTYVREIGTGEAYDVGKLAKRLGNTPEDDGDGERYKGRGLIQITGLSNYKALSKALSYDFVTNPEHLERPVAATMSAGWFWDQMNLNPLADEDDFVKITKRINGGYNGMPDRVKHWDRCKKVLGE